MTFKGKKVLITGGASGIGRIMGDVLGIYHTMDNFTGRK